LSVSASERVLKARRRQADLVLQRLQVANPDPKCELYHETPYQLLVSVVLSANATDKSVNRAMTEVYKRGFTPEVALDLGESGILERIRSIGLAPTKAKNVFRLSQILLEKYDGAVPNTRGELEALPGVGHKTASVILAEVYGEATIAVDTHVYRVGSRLGLHDAKNPLKAEQQLLNIIPQKYLPKAHHWLILHGRYTCKAIRPLCEKCVIADLCPYLESLSKNIRQSVLSKSL
jgi:endonuclease III